MIQNGMHRENDVQRFKVTVIDRKKGEGLSFNQFKEWKKEEKCILCRPLIETYLFFSGYLFVLLMLKWGRKVTIFER